jgi:hypothetical protein
VRLLQQGELFSTTAQLIYAEVTMSNEAARPAPKTVGTVSAFFIAHH